MYQFGTVMQIVFLDQGAYTTCAVLEEFIPNRKVTGFGFS